MAQGVNHCLCGGCIIAARAVRTFGQAGGGTGRCHCLICDHTVAQSGDLSLSSQCYTAALTLAAISQTGFQAGGCLTGNGDCFVAQFCSNFSTTLRTGLCSGTGCCFAGGMGCQRQQPCILFDLGLAFCVAEIQLTAFALPVSRVTLLAAGRFRSRIWRQGLMAGGTDSQFCSGERFLIRCVAIEHHTAAAYIMCNCAAGLAAGRNCCYLSKRGMIAHCACAGITGAICIGIGVSCANPLVVQVDICIGGGAGTGLGICAVTVEQIRGIHRRIYLVGAVFYADIGGDICQIYISTYDLTGALRADDLRVACRGIRTAAGYINCTVDVQDSVRINCSIAFTVDILHADRAGIFSGIQHKEVLAAAVHCGAGINGDLRAFQHDDIVVQRHCSAGDSHIKSAGQGEAGGVRRSYRK